MAEFGGFHPQDFDNLAGSSWRNRESLGGVLAEALTDQLGRPYESWGARRRLELHIAVREHYDSDDPSPSAKLFVNSHNLHTGARELAYGFYVESPPALQDRSHRHVHWLRFRDRLRERPALQTALLGAMADHQLVLGDYYRADEDGGAIGGKFVFRARRLQRWHPVGETWHDVQPVQLCHHIAQLPRIEAESQWVNLHVFARMGSHQAIELGAAVVEPLLSVLRALAPVYELTIAEQ